MSQGHGHGSPAAGGGQRPGAGHGQHGKGQSQTGNGRGPAKQAKPTRKPAAPKAKPNSSRKPKQTRDKKQGKQPNAKRTQAPRQNKQRPGKRAAQERTNSAGQATGVQSIQPGNDPDVRGTALALERAREQAAAERAMRLASSIERAQSQRQMIAALIAQRRASVVVHSNTIRTMATEREAVITRNEAYRAVSRQKSTPIMPPNRSFSPGARQGVKRGKKRGSEYYNKIIAKSLRGSGRGRRGGGRRRNNNNNINY